MSGGFSPLDRRRAFEAIVDQIREAIFSGRFERGARLPAERDLAAQFGVARHAVREAIRVLEHAGLVVVRRGAQGGLYVADVERDARPHLLPALVRAHGFTIEHLFQAKLLLEPPLAELAAARATDAQVERIAAAVEAERRAIGESDDAYPDIASFHLAIARVSANSLVDEILRALEESARLVHAAGSPPLSVYRLAHREHGTILAAIRRRRPRAAHDAMAEHLKSMETRYLRAAMPKRRAARTA